MSSQQTSEGMNRAKVSLPPEVDAELEEQLEYGDTKSGWIREAVIQRLEAENSDFERPGITDN